MKADPIIAVHNVKEVSNWYQAAFNCRSIHGGDEFDVLVTPEEEVLICLHKWGEHDHPSMMDPDVVRGNGLILYFRTHDMEEIYGNLQRMGYPIQKDIQMNPNSHRKEFSVVDPGGYQLIISEFHTFMG